MSRPSDWSVLGLDKDPAPGDLYAIRDLARRFLAFAADVEHARGQVTAATTGSVTQAWLGAAGDTFRDGLNGLPGRLSRLETSYRMAGQALKAYAPILDTAQEQAGHALSRGRDARARRDHAETLLGPAQTALTSAAASLTALARAHHPDAAGAGWPDPAQVTRALRDHETAQTRLERARGTVHSAQDEIETARRLALAAGQLRAHAAHTCARAIQAASHAGIRDRPWWSWEKIKKAAGAAWHATVRAAKITVAVFGVIAMLIGGPAAWIVCAAALVILADALTAYANGEASGWEVGFALLGCVPGGRGFTTTAGLARGLRGGAALARDARTAAQLRLTTMAAHLRGARGHPAMLAKGLLSHPAAATPNGHIRMATSDLRGNAHRSAPDTFRSPRGPRHHIRDGVPLGFAGQEEFQRFADTLHKGLRQAGYPEARGIMHGSSVTGASFRERVPFDVARKSDFDVAIADQSLFRRAREAGVEIRGHGNRTAPLRNRELKALDLLTLSRELSGLAGRKVAFMSYRDLSAAVSRSPSIIFPQ
ncbi:putative T7SS-secreted protein [Frankia sp. CiP3]|uniref:putative T7SS-secreted protein n=1 Tax=Frankia sp. CiP3 TaxID=2880971 RepID=UPI001EF5D66C|nr:hypothetical protein [Frankia sp. CiP3]